MSEASVKKSRLLSLPAELRMLIWEAVATIPIGITELWNVRIPQVPIATLIQRNFLSSRRLENNWQTNHTHELDGPDPMGWLRTNHQIYEEGKPIFDKLSGLRICNTVDFTIFLCPQWSSSALNRKTVRHLSFCCRAAIQRDPRGGFIIQHARERIRPAGPCSITPESPLDSFIEKCPFLQDWMPALKEIRLQLIFVCHSGPPLFRLNSQRQLNYQGRHVDQSRNQDALVFRGSKEEVRYTAYKLVFESNLMTFVVLGAPVDSSKLKVHVDVQMHQIEHDDGNDSGSSRETCWCKNRCIDPETFPVMVLTSAIQKALATK